MQVTTTWRTCVTTTSTVLRPLWLELPSYVEVRGGTRGRASGLGDGNDVIDMVTERKSGRYCQDSAQ